MSKTKIKAMHQKIEDFFYKISIGMDRLSFFNAVKTGFTYIFPVFMFGALALAIQYFPIEAVRNFFATALGGIFNDFFNLINICTYGIASIHILIAVSISYSNKYVQSKKLMLGSVLICNLGAYFICQGTSTEYTLSNFNVNNVFIALLISILCSKLFFVFHKLISKRKSKLLRSLDNSFSDTITCIYCIVIIILIFTVLEIIIEKVFHFTSLNNLIMSLLAAPFKWMGRNYGSYLLLTFMESFFWFFGVHGSNVFESVVQTVFYDVEGEFLCKSFFDTYVLMGGCGTMLCLVLAILIFSKNREKKNLAGASSFGLIFNISEPVLFGLPVVLNPLLVIPFILTPMICLTNSYLAVKWGILSTTSNAIYWTTPVFFNGYMMSGNISGTLVQLFNIIVGTLIYAPFIRMNDKVQRRLVEHKVQEMSHEIKVAESEHREPNLLDNDNSYHVFANKLIDEFLLDMDRHKVTVFYQPICNKKGEVVSCESLLRWFYQFDSYIYPPLLIDLLKESGHFDDYTKYILEMVMKDYVTNRINGPTISVNINVSQLTDLEFVNWIINKMNELGMPKDKLIVEVTEEQAITDDENTRHNFELLHENGIKLSIDDFSMGQTSIKFLQELKFDYVKLDGGLIRNVETNTNVQNIVKSVVALSNDLGFNMIAECVETEGMVKILDELGVKNYQGYYFSKAIPFNDYYAYYRIHNKK